MDEDSFMVEYEPMDISNNSDPQNPLHVIEYSLWLIQLGYDWMKDMDIDERAVNGKQITNMIKNAFQQITEMQNALSKMNASE